MLNTIIRQEKQIKSILKCHYLSSQFLIIPLPLDLGSHVHNVSLFLFLRICYIFVFISTLTMIGFGMFSLYVYTLRCADIKSVSLYLLPNLLLLHSLSFFLMNVLPLYTYRSFNIVSQVSEVILFQFIFAQISIDQYSSLLSLSSVIFILLS